MHQALLLIEQAITAQKQMLKGYERPSEVLAFETVRAVDKLFMIDLFPAEEDGTAPHQHGTGHSTMSWGVNHALCRIVPNELKPGPFALFRSTEQMQRQADDFLFQCGSLAEAERLSGWLREGLVASEVRRVRLSGSPETEFAIILNTADPSLYSDLIGRRGLRWTSDLVMAMDRGREEQLERRYNDLLPELTRSVSVFDDWGIRYTSSREIDDYFAEWAMLYLRRMYGQDLLDTEDVIGGYPYVEYLGVLAALSGRAQKHLCLSGILARRHPHLHQQNLLTTFCPLDEFLTGLTHHLDASTPHIAALIDHLMLTPENKQLHLASSETAWAPLVRASRDSLILPLYGLDINPFLFLLSELRQKYPSDWFAAANRREKRWIKELETLFPAPRWKTGANVKLKTNRQVITDIDFWALDTRDDSVALFQLKWQQPVGIDNRARRSAGRNLMDEGNRWIEAVDNWLDQNGLDALSTRIGPLSRKIERAKFFVVARYNAWFPGFSRHADKACWSDWSHLMRVRCEHPGMSVPEMRDRLSSRIATTRATIRSESYLLPIHNIVLLLNPVSIPPASG